MYFYSWSTYSLMVPKKNHEVTEGLSWSGPIKMEHSTRFHVCPEKSQISLRIRAVWSESSLSTWRRFRSLATDSEPCDDWSDCVDAQADLTLRWAHMQSCRKCCGPAQFSAHLSQRLEVSFCDRSSSVVRRPLSIVRLPSVNNLLKRHFLLNWWMDFEIILQEYSLGDPLPKLPKWFRSAKENGRQSLKKKRKKKPLNDISSQANGSISK